MSNAASYNHQVAVGKIQNLGIKVTSDEIITSRDATLADLDNRTWGCISVTADDLSDIPSKTLRLGDDPSLYAQADGFLDLSSTGWAPSRQALLSKALKARPRPVVIANADLAAPRETTFSQEPGYFGHRLVDQAERDVRFFGKPFAEVYALAEAGLGGIAPSRIAMVGDTLHTDIIGGAARAWRTVLVTQDGMFAGHDVRHFCHESGINPDWCVKRI